MRSTVSEDAPASTYPCLKIAPNTENIVLFTACDTGAIISSPQDWHSLGYHSTGWIEADFTPFSGKVTLSNDASNPAASPTMHSKKIDSTPATERQYPWLGVAYDGEVVLFTASGVGTAICQSKNGNKLGWHHGCWDMSHFTPFTGQIILSNSPIE